MGHHRPAFYHVVRGDFPYGCLFSYQFPIIKNIVYRIGQIGVLLFWYDEKLLVLVPAKGIAVFGRIVVTDSPPLGADKVRIFWQRRLDVIPVSLIADDTQIVAVYPVPHLTRSSFQYIPANLVICINAGTSFLQAFLFVGMLYKIQFVIVSYVVKFQPDVLIWCNGTILVGQTYADGITVSDEIAQDKGLTSAIF